MELSIKDQADKSISKEIIRLAIFETLGTVFVVFGLYGKFWANGDAFVELLNEQSNVNLVLTIGIVIWLYCWTEFIKYLRKKR